MNSAPIKLAILGANGQIATEVAMYLSGRDDVQMCGFTRSRYGTILLDLLGIPSFVIDFANITAENKALLADVDAVVDCTYPAGQQQKLAGLIESNAAAVMKCMKRGATYIHSSSISAFGMPIDSTQLRDYRFARTSYARTKRSAEKCLSQLAQRHGVRACHLRLGQVHGVLQSVTGQFKGLIEQGQIVSTGNTASTSTTVFCHAVAEAFLCAARGDFNDGSVTTVVSQAQWTLETLFDVYRDITGTSFSVTYVGESQHQSRDGLIARLIRLGTPFRNVLESQVLPLIPGVVPKLKGQYRMQSARRDRAAAVQALDDAPVFNLVGKVPGQVTGPINSSPQETICAFRNIETLLAKILDAASA
jgi:nucleoside-diphosphate-sugar epimerase